MLVLFVLCKFKYIHRNNTNHAFQTLKLSLTAVKMKHFNINCFGNNMYLSGQNISHSSMHCTVHKVISSQGKVETFHFLLIYFFLYSEHAK